MRPPSDAARDPAFALLLTRHTQAVRAARLQAIAPHGTVTSRKRQFAWKAAEAAFIASIDELGRLRQLSVQGEGCRADGNGMGPFAVEVMAGETDGIHVGVGDLDAG
jgi:hypothetical protein